MISREQRLKIYETLKSLGSVWGEWPREFSGPNKVEFLDKIWNLRLMDSSDMRYKDAYGDAVQHLSNNDDWDDDFTFLDRFHLLDCDEEHFLRFLTVAISPDFHLNRDTIIRKVTEIRLLLPAGYELMLKDDRGRMPIYEAMRSTPESELLPQGVAENTIPFFVGGYPEKEPAFFLRPDNWDDYGFKTLFRLYFCPENDVRRTIGQVKILQRDAETTNEVIPEYFTSLDGSFCSLGMDKDYYKNLKELFPESYLSILFALKDSAYFSDIADRFEPLLGFRNSLLRGMDAYDILLKVRRQLEMENVNGNTDFSFDADIPYLEGELLPVAFNFGDLEDFLNPHRVQALIGPNGAGKTSVLKSLVRALVFGNRDRFAPGMPLFSKVIAISFSVFDTFIDIRSRSMVNYIYAGIHDSENSIMSKQDRKLQLKVNLERINKDRRIDITSGQSVLSAFMGSLGIFFPSSMTEAFLTPVMTLDVQGILDRSDTMSSGESMILNLVAALYANMRYNTLIVFDELEVHLHPKAIRHMMQLLFRVTEQFRSACILATHSSIVVQELMADNVKILEKVEGCPEIRCLNHESLGENLSSISDEIFGEVGISPHYRRFIRDNAEYCDTFEDLLARIKSGDLPPSLSLYMQAKDIFETLKENKADR